MQERLSVAIIDLRHLSCRKKKRANAAGKADGVDAI
jgi:hypothetical protein